MVIFQTLYLLAGCSYKSIDEGREGFADMSFEEVSNFAVARGEGKRQVIGLELDHGIGS